MSEAGASTAAASVAAQPLTAADWLAAWEAAAAAPPGLREVALLLPACGADAQGVSRLPLGTRDALLLDLRQALFGARLDCIAACPSCGERCEWSCEVDALRDSTATAAPPNGTWLGTDAHGAGWQVAFRPVHSLDIAAAAKLAAPGDTAQAARVLLERCVTQACQASREVAASAIPQELHAAIGEAMAAADPQALSTVALNCPSCSAHWQADLDIGAFLWAEIDTWAQRLLAEVHRLALRYGWAERDIVAMSPARRAYYLAFGDA